MNLIDYILDHALAALGVIVVIAVLVGSVLYGGDIVEAAKQFLWSFLENELTVDSVGDRFEPSSDVTFQLITCSGPITYIGEQPSC